MAGRFETSRRRKRTVHEKINKIVEVEGSTLVNLEGFRGKVSLRIAALEFHTEEKVSFFERMI